MKNADDSKPSKNILPEDSDLGPEPDWLLDEVIEDEPVSDAEQSAPSESEGEPEPEVAVDAPSPEPEASFEKSTAEPGIPLQDSSSEPEITVKEPAADPPAESSASAGDVEHVVVTPEQQAPQSDTANTAVLPAESSDAQVDESEPVRRSHAWIWGLAPFVLLLATGLIAWFGTTQTLNGYATWDAIRDQFPPLLPARWAMTIWWLVLPLMMIFLIYGSLPAGREITRIKVTGPLISIGLAATTLWIIAQHWQWEVVGIASMGVASVAVLVTYLLVSLGKKIISIRQRLLTIIPLSFALGYSVMLTVLAWQSYSDQPFGERGSSVLFALLLVVIAAILAFFLRDGFFSLVLTIWFAGVVHHQWGEDAVISLIAAVTVLFTGALTVLGILLALESHEPSLTATVDNRRGRTSFFRKSKDSSPE